MHFRYDVYHRFCWKYSIGELQLDIEASNYSQSEVVEEC